MVGKPQMEVIMTKPLTTRAPLLAAQMFKHPSTKPLRPVPQPRAPTQQPPTPVPPAPLPLQIPPPQKQTPVVVTPLPPTPRVAEPTFNKWPACQRKAASDICRDWVEKTREKTEAGVLAEYELMKDDPQVPLLTFDAFAKAPRELKRHETMVVWDRSRVVLRGDKKPSDFIHANYVGGPYTSKDFILSQGPLEDTIDDFWWMVWQERVNLIVMLCQCTEGVGAASRQKCAQYWWPSAGGAVSGSSHGQMLVKTLDVEDLDDKGLDGTLVRLSRLSLSFKTAPTEQAACQTVLHLQMLNWPDMDVPASPLGLIRFQNIVREEEKKLRTRGLTTPTSPILVHCSAGVGRSGTFVALILARYILLEAVGEPLDLVQLVRRLRRERHSSVQTPPQYLFLYTALLQLLKSTKFISPDVGLAPSPPRPDSKPDGTQEKSNTKSLEAEQRVPPRRSPSNNRRRLYQPTPTKKPRRPSGSKK